MCLIACMFFNVWFGLHILCIIVILGVYTFTHTVRRPKIKDQRVELRKQISGRTYQVKILLLLLLLIVFTSSGGSVW